MPEMDGFELMKTVRAEFPDLHIICMTGHGGAYSYTDVVSFGATDYITKPFTIDEMSAKLNRVLREKKLIEDLKEKKIELELANAELKQSISSNQPSSPARPTSSGRPSPSSRNSFL